METSDLAFPIRYTDLCLDIMVMATQIGSTGTILQARKEEGVLVDPTFTVSVVFGKRDESMLVACARQLVEHISNSGSRKSLVLSLGLIDHSMGTLKGIVSVVIEKLAENGVGMTLRTSRCGLQSSVDSTD